MVPKPSTGTVEQELPIGIMHSFTIHNHYKIFFLKNPPIIRRVFLFLDRTILNSGYSFDKIFQKVYFALNIKNKPANEN